MGECANHTEGNLCETMVHQRYAMNYDAVNNNWADAQRNYDNHNTSDRQD